MKILYFKQKSNFYKNIFKEENSRIIDVYKYNNCTLSGINLYYPNILIYEINKNNLILPVIEKTMSLNISSIYESNMEYNYKKEKKLYSYKDPLFFFVYNTDNYFHFLYDSLPYLISYLNLKETCKNIKW